MIQLGTQIRRAQAETNDLRHCEIGRSAADGLPRMLEDKALGKIDDDSSEIDLFAGE